MTQPPIDPVAPPPEPSDPTAPSPLGYQPSPFPSPSPMPAPPPFEPYRAPAPPSPSPSSPASAAGGPPYDTDYPPYRPGHASVPPTASYRGTSDVPVTAVPAYWLGGERSGWSGEGSGWSGSEGYPPGPEPPRYPPGPPPDYPAGTHQGYQPGPPPQFVQPRRRSRAAVFAIVATVVTVLVCGACGLGGFVLARRSSGGASTNASAQPAVPAPRSSPSAPKTTHAAARHTISYEVTGAGYAIITFGSTGGLSQDQAKLPWHKEVGVQQDNFAVSLLAFTVTGQQMTCRVLVDGKQVAKETSDRSVACTQLVTH